MAAGKPAAIFFAPAVREPFEVLAGIRCLPAVGAGRYLVLVYFAAQGVAVNAQDFCGAGAIAVGALQSALDEFFLELDDGFFEQDSALDHLSDQGLELFFHGRTLHSDASRNAVRGPVLNRVDGR